MDIADRYRQYLSNLIIREYLTDQTIPSIENIEADLAIIEEWFTDMSFPMAYFLDLQVDEREESSASLYNQMQETFFSDLSVLYQQVTTQLQDSNTFLNRNLAEIQMLKAKLKNLEDRVTELLLRNKDTEGYFQFFADTFNSLQYVDTVNTTAAIDLRAGIVTMKEGISETRKFNLNFTQYEDMSFQVLTRYGVQGSTNVADMSSIEAFKDGEESWRQEVISTAPITMSVQLVLDMKEIKEVSKVDYESFNDQSFGIMTVQVQYSNDNYNWFDFPSDFPTQNIYHKGTFTGVATDMRYLKFILTKTSYDRVDEGRYVYYFGAKHVDIFGVEYDQDGSVLQTKEIYPEEKAGQDAYINRVSIEACEDVPSGTDILYDVSFDGGNEWVPISPVNRSNPKFPQVASLNKIQLEMGSLVGMVAVDGVVDIHNIALDYDASTLDAISTTVWRNVGTQGDVDTVRTYQKGWSFDDEYYSCYVWVDSFYGLEIDLGDTTAELDGASITGIVTIPYGRHFFRTRQTNWRSLGAFTNITAETKAGVITDDVQGAITDPLYPYNHKYLIEGIPYDSTVTSWDNQAYLGVDVFAGRRPTLVSSFDMLNNAKDDDYDRFAKRGDQIIVKYDPGDPDVANEEFIVQSFTSSASDLPTYVIFRATLTSNIGSITPVLYDYKIKFDPYYETV
jgi:hypothetical protein